MSPFSRPLRRVRRLIRRRVDRRSQIRAGEWRRQHGVLYMACLRCEGLISLDDHEIDDQGTVEPMVECIDPDCSWGDWCRLSGWGVN